MDTKKISTDFSYLDQIFLQLLIFAEYSSGYFTIYFLQFIEIFLGIEEIFGIIKILDFFPENNSHVIFHSLTIAFKNYNFWPKFKPYNFLWGYEMTFDIMICIAVFDWKNYWSMTWKKKSFLRMDLCQIYTFIFIYLFPFR